MSHYDLIVIGAGPAGYHAAIRGAQLGMKVACIDAALGKDGKPALGGTCLRVGCIPSKALLESSERFADAKHHMAEHGVKVSGVEVDLKTMLGRKDRIVTQLTGGIDFLFKKNKVTKVVGHGRLDGPGKVTVKTVEGDRTLQAKHILIATGSTPSGLKGIAFDGDRIGTSTEALAYPEVPKRLVVVGAGVIGLELGSVWARLGSQVTVLEYLPRILPGVDGELATAAQKLFTKQGMTFKLGVRVTGARVVGSEVEVSLDGQEPVKGDRCLVAVGRRPYTDGLGLETVGIELDPRGRVPVDPHTFATKAKGVYAVGDVIVGAMLAHKASEEAVACVEMLVTGVGHVCYEAIPNVVYTNPELASVGKSEEELKEAKVPFMPNGRAKALGQTDGLVKVLAHEQTDRVLGVHILGPRAGDLIAEVALAVEFGASSEDIARTVHAHPTLAEVVKEAAMAVAGRAIHG
jgi:dihydrolipoamide dehydrogenase